MFLGKAYMTEKEKQNEPGKKPPRKAGDQFVRLASLFCLVALVVILFSIRQLVDEMQISLDTRLSKIENRLAQLPSGVNTAAQQPQRGPDPNRVYTINTAGAPIKGPDRAPIVIAEFSDFQ